MLRPSLAITLLTLAVALGLNPAVAKDRPANSAEVTGTFTIPADHAAIEGVTLRVILYEYDPLLADVGANPLDQVDIADVAHKPGEPTVVKFTAGSGKTTRPDRGYYLSVRGYRGDAYVYYGVPGQGGIGRVLTEGHPREVKYTGKRMQK